MPDLLQKLSLSHAGTPKLMQVEREGTQFKRWYLASRRCGQWFSQRWAHGAAPYQVMTYDEESQPDLLWKLSFPMAGTPLLWQVEREEVHFKPGKSISSPKVVNPCFFIFLFSSTLKYSKECQLKSLICLTCFVR